MEDGGFAQCWSSSPINNNPGLMFNHSLLGGGAATPGDVNWVMSITSPMTPRLVVVRPVDVIVNVAIRPSRWPFNLKMSVYKLDLYTEHASVSYSSNIFLDYGMNTSPILPMTD